MNKKLMKLLAGMFILVMVVVGCSTVKDEATKASSTSMEKDDMKDEAMAEEAMTDEAMTDEAMDKDTIGHADDAMKDDAMADDSMKDETMTEVAMMNEGKMAPDFELMDINGNLVKLEELKGDKVYLKFWASWCSICLAGLEEVDELFLEAQDFTPYTVVTPGANGEQSKEDFINWYNGLGYENINVLFDIDGKLAKEFGVRAFPTSVFIGSDGILIQSAPGHKSNEDIQTVINSFY